MAWRPYHDTWDPVAHQPVAGTNTFEADTANRFAAYLDDAPSDPMEPVLSRAFGSSLSTYWGVPTVGSAVTDVGTVQGTFHINQFMAAAPLRRWCRRTTI